MTRQQVVQHLVAKARASEKQSGSAFAPSNIALCKYWGKRDAELNLPVNSSLSISLGHLGTETLVSRAPRTDQIILNEKELAPDSTFANRLKRFLDLFRPQPDFYFKVLTKNNFPTAAGLASSASGYAALVMALDDFFDWHLDKKSLSILARLGSGSASRSVYKGFVLWHRGEREDGLDSFAERLDIAWPELRLAVVTVSAESKAVGSTEGMKQTVATSTLYQSWPQKAQHDLNELDKALQHKEFDRLGQTAESNALAMHATMLDTQPPVLYWLPETVRTFAQIWHLRKQGHALYFTIDAGPNVKILFLQHQIEFVKAVFPDCETIAPFVKTL